MDLGYRVLFLEDLNAEIKIRQTLNLISRAKKVLNLFTIAPAVRGTRTHR